MGGNTLCNFIGSWSGNSPQWSRPVMGGNTWEVRLTHPDHNRPQWSRPVMGGNTTYGTAQRLDLV